MASLRSFLRRLFARAPERRVWCAVCGRELPVSKAVVVADTFDDDEQAFGGGTVCLAEYCPEHAPEEAA